VTLPPLQAFTASAPNSALIGIIGEKGSGKRALLKAAAGMEAPASGSVTAGKNRRYLYPADELNFSPVDVLLLDNTLAARCHRAGKGRRRPRPLPPPGIHHSTGVP